MLLWGPRLAQETGSRRGTGEEPDLGQREAVFSRGSDASLIQARIQILLAFPDGLIVWVGNRWWPLLVLSPLPAASTCSSCHRLGLGLSILAPVVNQQQQAQSDADVHYDNCGHRHHIHLHAVLTHSCLQVEMMARILWIASSGVADIITTLLHF